MSMSVLKRSLLALVHFNHVRGLIDSETATKAYQGY